MSILDDVIALLGRRRTRGLLGIEGLPYSGKTTLANQLAHRYGLLAVAEHTVFDPSLEHLARAPWPQDEASVLDRQRRFLHAEIRRSQIAVSAQRGAVMDRTLISVIAHLFLRTRHIPNGDDLLCRFLDECAHEIDRGNVVIAQSLIFLPTTPKAARLRATGAIQDGDRRRTEPFLLQPGVLSNLHAFYRRLSVRLDGKCDPSQTDELARNLNS